MSYGCVCAAWRYIVAKQSRHPHTNIMQDNGQTCPKERTIHHRAVLDIADCRCVHNVANNKAFNGLVLSHQHARRLAAHALHLQQGSFCKLQAALHCCSTGRGVLDKIASTTALRPSCPEVKRSSGTLQAPGKASASQALLTCRAAHMATPVLAAPVVPPLLAHVGQPAVNTGCCGLRDILTSVASQARQ